MTDGDKKTDRDKDTGRGETDKDTNREETDRQTDRDTQTGK